MTLQEALDAAGSASRLATQIYRDSVDALCRGTAQPLHELEEKRRIAHEAERDLQGFQIQILGAIANPFKRKRVAEIVATRAEQANQLLASIDQSFERSKATGERVCVSHAMLQG